MGLGIEPALLLLIQQGLLACCADCALEVLRIEELVCLVPTPLEEVLLEQRRRELEARNPLPKGLPLLFSMLPSEDRRVKHEARARLETIRVREGQ